MRSGTSPVPAVPVLPDRAREFLIVAETALSECRCRSSRGGDCRALGMVGNVASASVQAVRRPMVR